MATEFQIDKKREKLERAQAKLAGGGAPVVLESNYRTTLMLALCYYNANMENRERAKVVLNYLKKNNKPYYDVLTDAPDYELLTLGSLITIKSKGEYLSPEDDSRITERLDSLYAKYSEKPEEVKEEKVDTPVVSVQDRVTEVARKHMAEIDNEIDKFVINKASAFSLKDYAAKNGLSAAVTKKIAEFYKKLDSELKETIDGKDEQLIEGYSYFSTAQLKKFSAFISTLIEDAETQTLKAKANRAPRKRKEKPAAIQVAKLQYLDEFPELGLKSVHPTKIIGAQQVWTYNIKNKKLAVYYSSSSKGFTVKGTSLQAWDPEVSAQNGLRKPAVTIKEVLDGGKLQLQKILGKLTTITTKPNGRFNSDTIIVRVL